MSMLFRYSPLVLLFICLASPFAVHAETISSSSLERIAALIFQNECASKDACLTAWNKGEKFASLGIGHFIWYPAGTSERNKRFSESFPRLMHFIDQQKVKIPAWIQADKGCPWPNREAFENAQKTQKMIKFRSFLIKTMPFQASFMQKRLKNALSLMLTHVPEVQRSHIRQQFARVAAAPMGMYALMDYVNFKGEGVNPKERYHGKGWGLLQVLAAMHGKLSGIAAITEFSTVAEHLLIQRIDLSPSERHESRWLTGWEKRLTTYVNESRNTGI